MVTAMDPETKKRVLRKIVHGVYVAGVKDGEKLNAFTATWISQMSFKPPLIAFGVNKESISYKMIEKSRVFSINILEAGQKQLAQHFLKPAHLEADKLEGVRYRLGTTGTPILEDAIAYFECEVRDIHPGGDHAIVIGEVVETGLQRDVDPLTLMETGWHYGG
jgi:flavin reductase (DIM6/NTAB) family NADH-FMN oxidoreductase RutF